VKKCIYFLLKEKIKKKKEIPKALCQLEPGYLYAIGIPPVEATQVESM